jgi:hypothetical protein
MESENMKIDTEKIETPRVLGIHADEISSVEKELIVESPEIRRQIKESFNSALPRPLARG